MRRLNFIWTLLFVQSIQGQSCPVASGGSAQGAGGSMSFSLGQVACSTAQGNGGANSQGVQQPYEYLVLAVETDLAHAEDIGVSPNPTSEGVHLIVKKQAGDVFHYDLVDAAGQILRTGRVDDTEVNIAMGDLPSAIYLLRIIGATSRTFQIIKQ